MDEILPILNTIGSVATALGLAFTALQLRLSGRQAVTDFEDSLAQEYRSLAATIPTKALLGDELTEQELTDSLDEFYHYFDLSNSQIFLRQIGRVSKKTFLFWRDGIQTHLKRKAFEMAWEKISAKAEGDFKELRRLRAEGFKTDPRKWKSKK